MDNEGLLGPLPSPWMPKRCRDYRGIKKTRFFNSETKQTISLENDPRLGDLPQIWERMEVKQTPDDPFYIQRYINKITGEIINSDPRLLPQSLRKRGVNLQTFKLV